MAYRIIASLLPILAVVVAIGIKSFLEAAWRTPEEQVMYEASKAVPSISELYTSSHPSLQKHLDPVALDTRGRIHESLVELLGGREVVFLQEPGHDVTGHRYIYDPLLGWRNIPNWKAKTRGKPLTVNSRGLRDREHQFKKSEDAVRAVVLGDSFAWGYGVGDGDTFSDVLERLLKKIHSEAEVINTGVSGWGTDQEYLFLVSEGYRYAPDLVILAFYFNDPINNSHPVQYGMPKPYFDSDKLILKNVPVPISSRPHLPHKATSGVRITLALIRELQTFCESISSKFLLVKFGASAESDGDALLAKEIEKSLMSSDASYFLDLDLAFTRLGITRDELLAGNDDGHWNAFGHQRAGQILMDFILGTDGLNKLLERPK